jgi:hypothetical protein
MGDYPKDWAEGDLDAAAAALKAAGVEVKDRHESKNFRRLEFVLDGRACSLTERKPKRHGEWVALDFPYPAAWPDIMLGAVGEPYDADYADPTPPVGHSLSSHDLPAARAVVDAGFAAASVDPPAGLSVEAFDGAMITTDPRVTLNGSTSAWLLNLARLALAAAPPIDPADSVTARSYPASDQSGGLMQGARAEVFQRLLWLARVNHDEGTDESERTGRLRRALDRWIDTAAVLVADRRAGAADTRDGVRTLAAQIGDELHRAGMGDDDEIVMSDFLSAILIEVHGWDA